MTENRSSSIQESCSHWQLHNPKSTTTLQLYGRDDAMELLQHIYQRSSSMSSSFRHNENDDADNNSNNNKHMDSVTDSSTAATATAAVGCCEVVWISGPAGSGKTALTRAFAQTMVLPQGGLLGCGKFHPPMTVKTTTTTTTKFTNEYDDNENNNNSCDSETKHDGQEPVITDCITSSLEAFPLIQALSEWIRQILQMVQEQQQHAQETREVDQPQNEANNHVRTSLSSQILHDMRTSIQIHLKSHESHELLCRIIPGLQSILMDDTTKKTTTTSVAAAAPALPHQQQHQNCGGGRSSGVMDIKVILTKFIVAMCMAMRTYCISLVLCLDDLQWADDVTMHVLQNVILHCNQQQQQNDKHGQSNDQIQPTTSFTTRTIKENAAADDDNEATTIDNGQNDNQIYIHDAGDKNENHGLLFNNQRESRTASAASATLSSSLLIVGTFRHDHTNHALSQMMQAIQQGQQQLQQPQERKDGDHNNSGNVSLNNNSRITRIFVDELSEVTIQQMILDAWNGSNDEINNHTAAAAQLAHCIYLQTKGNALFVQQTIRSLQTTDVSHPEQERSNEDVPTCAFDPKQWMLLNAETTTPMQKDKVVTDDDNHCWDPKHESMDGNWKRMQDNTNKNKNESDHGIVAMDFVAMTAYSMKQHEASIRNQLMVAACLGNQFPMDVWQAVSSHVLPCCDHDGGEATSRNFTSNVVTSTNNNHQQNDSMPAKSLINMGYLLETRHDENGQFKSITITLQWQHDLIWQAAYSLLPEQERPIFHESIGWRLLRSLPISRVEDNIFLVLSQFSHGVGANGRRDLATCSPNNEKEGEKILVAKLCLQAGEKAALASSFQTASSCLNLGITMLGDDSAWRYDYDLCLSLHNAAAEASFCVTDFERMDRHLISVLQHVKAYSDSTRARTMQIYSLGSRGRHEKAFNLGIEALRQLGVHFPKSEFFLFDYLWTWRMLQGKTDRRLLSLPPMKDENMLAAMSILFVFMSTCSICRPQMLPFITTRTVRLTLKYGLCPSSSLAFLFFGVSLLHFGKRRTGFRYGQLGLRIVDMLNAKEYLPRSYMLMYAYINPWSRPLRDSLNPLEYAYRAGLETGDIDTTVKCRFRSCKLLLWSGRTLPEVQAATRQSHDLVKLYKQDGFLHVPKLLMQFCDNFMTSTKDPSVLSGAVITYDEAYQVARQTNNHYMLVDLPFLGLWLAVYWNNYELALERAAEGRIAIIRGKIACFVVCLHRLYEGVAAISLSYLQGKNKKQYVSLARQNLHDLQTFEKDTPENCHNKVLLLQALLAAHEGKIDAALSMFDRSINLAAAEGFIHEQALACELAGMTLRRINDFSSAGKYFKMARDLYLKWGADVKAIKLTQMFGLTA